MNAMHPERRQELLVRSAAILLRIEARCGLRPLRHAMEDDAFVAWRACYRILDGTAYEARVSLYPGDLSSLQWDDRLVDRSGPAGLGLTPEPVSSFFTDDRALLDALAEGIRWAKKCQMNRLVQLAAELKNDLGE